LTQPTSNSVTLRLASIAKKETRDHEISPTTLTYDRNLRMSRWTSI